MKRRVTIWQVWRADILAGGTWERHDFQDSRYAMLRAKMYPKHDLVRIEKTETIYENKAYLAWMSQELQRVAADSDRKSASETLWDE